MISQNIDSAFEHDVRLEIVLLLNKILDPVHLSIVEHVVSFFVVIGKIEQLQLLLFCLKRLTDYAMFNNVTYEIMDVFDSLKIIKIKKNLT